MSYSTGHMILVRFSMMPSIHRPGAKSFTSNLMMHINPLCSSAPLNDSYKRESNPTESKNAYRQLKVNKHNI